MKLTLVLLAVLGLTYGAPHAKSPRNLKDDLDDFLALIPTDKVLAIALDYLANDEEVQKAVEYLQSDDFKTIVLTVDSEPETKELLNYLEDNGLAAYDFLNDIHDILGIPHVNPKHSAGGTRTIRKLIDDILAILPIEDLKALYHEKLETSPDFKNLIDTVSSQKYHDLVLKIKALPETQALVQKLKELGVDVDKIIEIIKKAFGWTVRSTRTLKDDLDDFLALIPTDKILAIALEYLANDEEVQHAVEYLQSAEFKNIVVTVDNEPETKELLNYLEDNGLAAYDFLNGIHALLHIPPINPKHSAAGTRTIRNLVDDILAILPIEDLKALYDEKLKTSPDFKNLIDTVSSEKYHNLVLKIKALPEVQALVQKLKDLGIDFDKIVQIIKAALGWTVRSTRTLKDDLDDFLALIPTDKILAIALEYLANDAEVQHAVEYLQSDEFKNIVVTIDSEPETKELLNYLEDNGLAAYDFLNGIHDILGIPPINPKHSAAGTRTLRNLVDDILAILPIEDLKALYHEKLYTSPDFKNLIDTISSQKYHNLVLKIRALPETQALVQKLKDLGIDVDLILQIWKGWELGWTGRSTRNLKDDLNDFLALVPTDEILTIALEYVANDAEVQHAVEYLLSDEFKNIVVTIDSEPETKELLNYLEDNGLAVYEFLNDIHHDILGIPPINPKHSAAGTRTIRNFVDDILAILPIEDLKALFYEKLETSPDFKNLIDTVSSEKYHNLVLKIKALPEVQALVQKLKDLGFDVDKVTEIIKSLFGWTN